MTTFNINDFITGYGKTEGDKREFALCAYYGIIRTKHDSKPYTTDSDIEIEGMNISVKAGGASLMSGKLCEGCKTFEGIWRRFRRNVHSDTFAYVTSDFTVYMMSIDEFSKFIHAFAYLDRESTKNGGGIKIKIKNESGKMLRWLDSKVTA